MEIPRIYQSQQMQIWTELTPAISEETLEEIGLESICFRLDSLGKDTTDLSKSADADLDWPDLQQ